MKTSPAVLKTLIQASELHNRGASEDARTLISAVLVASPNYHLLTRRGIRQDAQGNLEAATLYFRQAAEQRPRYARAHYNLGIALSEQGHSEASLVELRLAVSLDPNDADIHEWLGDELAKAHLTDEALLEFDRAIQLRPECVRAYISKALIWWELAEEDQTIAKQQKWEQARAVFQEAVTVAPTKAEAHYGLGACELSLKHFPEAITALQTAIRLSPDTEHYYMALAKAQWHSRRGYAFCQTSRTYCRLKIKAREAAANLAPRNVVE